MVVDMNDMEQLHLSPKVPQFKEMTVEKAGMFIRSSNYFGVHNLYSKV